MTRFGKMPKKLSSKLLKKFGAKRKKKAKKKSTNPDYKPFVEPFFPGFVTEHRFHDVRKFRFDFAWVNQKVAIEVNGGIWRGGRHNRGKGYMKDMEKLNLAQSLGWRVFQFSPQQIRKGEFVEIMKVVLDG